MWGYYANGFKGIAIEINVDENAVKEIKYLDKISDVADLAQGSDDAKAKELLARKLRAWEHEHEYRFLGTSGHEDCEIGKITAVYFGNPYGGIYKKNQEEIYNHSEALRCYNCHKSALIQVANRSDIKCASVKIVTARSANGEESLAVSEDEQLT